MKIKSKVVRDGKKGPILGTLYYESCEGRLAEIIAEHGAAAVEAALDKQFCQHECSSAFKSEPTKGEIEKAKETGVAPKKGLLRLPTFPDASRWLYRSTKAEAEKEGYEVTNVPDGAVIAMINWSYKPGQSTAAVKAAEAAAEKEAMIVKSIEAQLELLAMNGTEITEEFKSKVENFVRAKFA